MTFHLDLTQDEVNVIAAGLAELPMKVAANTWMDVQKQIQGQQDEQKLSIQPEQSSS